MSEDAVEIQVTITNVRKFIKGPLLAMVDCIISISGVEFQIRALTITKIGDNLAIMMPMTKNGVGHPVSAIIVPPELHNPIVIAAADVLGIPIVEDE